MKALRQRVEEGYNQTKYPLFIQKATDRSKGNEKFILENVMHNPKIALVYWHDAGSTDKFHIHSNVSSVKKEETTKCLWAAIQLKRVSNSSNINFYLQHPRRSMPGNSCCCLLLILVVVVGKKFKIEAYIEARYGHGPLHNYCR